LSRI
jgi:hypothetical protein